MAAVQVALVSTLKIFSKDFAGVAKAEVEPGEKQNFLLFVSLPLSFPSVLASHLTLGG